jgi:hypothetical protein
MTLPRGIDKLKQKTEENNRGTGCPLPPSLGYLQYSRRLGLCQTTYARGPLPFSAMIEFGPLHTVPPSAGPNWGAQDG